MFAAQKPVFHPDNDASRRMNAGGNCAIEHRRFWIKKPALLVRVRRWKQNFQAIGCGQRPSRCWRARSACTGNSIQPSGSRSPVAWEPPVDILETERAVLVLVALPGVDFDEVKAVINQGELLISGSRTYPEEMRTAIIHRLELPQGRFERRVRLPAGRYSAIHRSHSNGHMLITLEKSEARKWLTPRQAPKRRSRRGAFAALAA